MHLNGCKEYNLSGGCIDCNDGYELYLEKCYIEIFKCEEYHLSGKCSKCESNHVLFEEQCYE